MCGLKESGLKGDVCHGLEAKPEGFWEVGGKTVRSERRPWERAAGTVLRLMRARWGGADWH